MMYDDTLSLVITGHVDHGKSTLIGRLLYDTQSLAPDKIREIEKASASQGRDTEYAYLMDHLEEERSGGITIDTTQTFFETAQRRYVIIDAPGHAEFIKNMITGATQADAAVLIVDASEGVRDQTRRHAYMLSLLGLNQIIVVINKMDRVDFAQSRFAEVRQCMADLLDSIGLDPILYVPICAIRGDNVATRSASMGWYKGPTFIEGLDSLAARQPPIDRPLLVSIQDVYQIGERQVGVGRVESGVLSKGLQIRILPRGHTTTVATIDKFLEDPQSAVAGECIGLTTVDSAILNRGDVICLSSEEPILTDRISASVFWMAGHDLTKDLRLTIRCTTQETGCTIEHINRRIDSSRLELIEEDAQVLKELEVGEVIIKTDRPILTKDFADVPPFGRFVLVEGDTTCAGGIVTPHREPEG
jgi:translation elongation factor TU